MRKKEKYTISFRLDMHYLVALEARAALSTLSVHEEARRMVVDHLEDTDRLRILEEIQSLRGLMEMTRSDLAEMLVTLLVEIGDVDEKEAKEYVSAYLRSRPNNVK